MAFSKTAFIRLSDDVELYSGPRYQSQPQTIFLQKGFFKILTDHVVCDQAAAVARESVKTQDNVFAELHAVFEMHAIRILSFMEL